MTQMPKEQFYYLAAHAGAVLLVGLGIAYVAGAPDFWKGFIVGALIVAVVVLFRQKLRDEYAERLWNAGTAGAFGVTLITAFSPEFLSDAFRGFADGFGGPGSSAITPTPGVIGTFALIGFFAAFHLALWRNRA